MTGLNTAAIVLRRGRHLPLPTQSVREKTAVRQISPCNPAKGLLYYAIRIKSCVFHGGVVAHLRVRVKSTCMAETSGLTLDSETHVQHHYCTCGSLFCFAGRKYAYAASNPLKIHKVFPAGFSLPARISAAGKTAEGGRKQNPTPFISQSYRAIYPYSGGRTI